LLRGIRQHGLWSPLGSGGLSFGANDDVEKVKAATDLVRLIGESIALKPKGREYAGLCPFHNDGSPSMMVSPNKQIYKCFACGAGGDALTFVVKYHRMEFREALEFLADRAGIALTKRAMRSTSDDAPQGPTRTDLLGAGATAQEFFRAILKHEQHGATAREVIAKRGISPEMQEAFGLGASPDRWDGLLITLQRKNLAPQPFHEVGLLKTRESGGSYDAFRNRVMFPICDALGRVIAFGARKINPEDEPKYLNSSENRLFKKSSTLYALHLASRTIQSTKTALICEGYTDVIACHQAGFTNAVATLGTALTREHAPVLRRICENVVLLFDGDQAGQRAADRAAEVFFAEPLDVRIVSLEQHTDAKDPDELLKRADGRAVFAKALAGATDILAHRFGRVRARLEGASDATVARTITAEVERLAELGLSQAEPLRQTLIVKRLAQLAGVDERLIRGAIPAGRSSARRVVRPGADGGDGANAGSLGGDEDSEQSMQELLAAPLHTATLTTHEHIVGCVLCDGSLWAGLGERDKDMLAPSRFRWEVLRRVAQLVHDVGEDGEPPSTNAVLARARTQGDAGNASEVVERVCEAAVQLMSRVYEATEGKPERLRQHFADCLKRARNEHALSVELKPAERGRPAEQGPTASGDAKEGSPKGDAASLASTLAKLRQVGPDLRRLPRPSG
jgi:DNA primase